MEYHSIIRLATALIATLAAAFFTIRMNDDWRQLSRGWKLVRVSLLGLITVGVIGSIEVLFMAGGTVPLGIRNVLLPTSLIGVLLGLWMIRKDYSPGVGGWIRASEVQQILEDVVEEEHGDTCQSAACVRARLRLWSKIKCASSRTRM